MKKYITLAALLAAGTTFANAVSLDDANKTVGGNIGYNTDGGNFTVALTLDVEALRSALELGQQKSWGTNLVNYVANGTNTGVVFNGGSNSNSKITSSGLYARWGDNINWNSTCWTSGSDLADLNGDAEGTGWDSVAYAGLVYSFGSASGTAVAFTLLDAEKNAIVDSYLYASGLKAGSAGAAALTFDDSVATSYYFNSYMGGNEVNMKSLSNLAATTAPVPEPSAFGMLAGLGALALVASRRRRK